MKTLSKSKAVEYAFNWHGGMSSPLYSFASYGGVVHTEDHKQGLVAEVQKALKWCWDNHDKPFYKKEYSREVPRLERLLDFIRKQTIKGA